MTMPQGRSVPLWAAELAAAPFDARAQQYRLADAPGVQGFRCVRVLGVCVRVSRAAAAPAPQLLRPLATQLEIGAQDGNLIPRREADRTGEGDMSSDR